jgi:hypothetical protein
MRADSAVEPTKSENITVTWRRSARSSGCALGALGARSPGYRRAPCRPYPRVEPLWHRVGCGDAQSRYTKFF